MGRFSGFILLMSLALLGAGGMLARPEGPDEAGIELYEKAIRPVVAERCLKCHDSRAGTPKGGLALETREGMLRGGDSGLALGYGNDSRQSGPLSSRFLHNDAAGRFAFPTL
jgi:hypothetical protein